METGDHMTARVAASGAERADVQYDRRGMPTPDLDARVVVDMDLQAARPGTADGPAVLVESVLVVTRRLGVSVPQPVTCHDHSSPSSTLADRSEQRIDAEIPGADKFDSNYYKPSTAAAIV